MTRGDRTIKQGRDGSPSGPKPQARSAVLQVLGSAPAPGRCRVRPAPDLSNIPPQSGRISFSIDPRGACRNARGGRGHRDLHRSDASTTNFANWELIPILHASSIKPTNSPRHKPASVPAGTCIHAKGNTMKGRHKWDPCGEASLPFGFDGRCRADGAIGVSIVPRGRDGSPSGPKIQARSAVPPAIAEKVFR